VAKKPNSKPTKPAELNAFFKVASQVMTKVGVMGFLVISLIAYIFFFVPPDQKRELTDTWLLFKNRDAQPLYVIFIVILCGVVFVNMYFSRKALNLKMIVLKK
jgi:hypothetical protein